jgi:hypothetical protein
MKRILIAALPAIACAAFCALEISPRPAADLVWPNAQSSANSDEWLIKNHDRIKQLRPRLLVINFMNGLSKTDAMLRVDRLRAALAEASRYHGYEDPSAPPFIDYQLFKFVDLTDPKPLPDDKKLDGNSSLYPRQPDTGDSNFRYDELFGKTFANYYGIRDADGHSLTLSELVNKGKVNEVWFLANQGAFGAPYESVELKQQYDAAFHKEPGKYVQAGNGGSRRQPWIGRSLRILFINASRGPGCAMESLGHSLEWTATSGAIPYFKKYFTEFADFDLDKRYGLPFSKFYDRGPTELDYPNPSTLVYSHNGEKRTVENYAPRGGSVHFMPSARYDYDLDNTEPVNSSIEHYRQHDGPGGHDKIELWTKDKIDKYRKLANDCQGPWLVYWRQNMPGLGNKSVDDDGKPMKNWWPFLFY